ncbi:MAG TPA: type 2 lanthipeptide synthetase LanM family protein [Candidatus Angelobacter sp.]
MLSSWPAALNLSERLALLRSKKPATGDVALAQRRFTRWQKETVFTEGELLLEQRLAADGISETEFLSLLGTPAAELAGSLESPPEWASTIARSYEESSNPFIMEVIQESKEAGGKSTAFLVAASGLITDALNRLQDGIRRFPYARLPFAGRTIEKVLFKDILGLLSGMIGRTMVLELNVARIQERLPGSDPEERFRSFIERLSTQEPVRALWEEYPVLARQLVVSLKQWADNSIEFLDRLSRDWFDIEQQFNAGQEMGLLKSLKSGGDRHNQGRCVSIVGFESGLQVVYKPRPLAADLQFQRLLAWVNDRRKGLTFQTLDILAGENYGWVRFVDSRPCNSQEEVRRFYRRQGGYLALLNMVHATDFHFENLIACGEHPVLVDLETLFHPNLFLPDNDDPLVFAYEHLRDSVYRVGLLPFRFAVNDEQREGIEISGLGGKGKQKTPYPVAAWEGAATDAMRFVRKRIEMPAQRNRPSLQGAEINALEYQEEIIAGFTDMYLFLEQHREQLLAPDGPLAPFADVPVRCIARPTEVYGSLMAESYHPNLLRDALDRERLFEDLWAETGNNPVLKKLISHERNDLWNNDIPAFTARPASFHLWTSSGQMIPDFLHETPMALVQRRLRQMGGDDLKRQIWFIRAAMTALAMEEPNSVPATPPPDLPIPEAGPQDFLAVAIAAGEHLLETAIRGPAGGVAWIGLDSALEAFWELTPAGLELYNGIPGIALFLAYLGHTTGKAPFTLAAEEAVTTVLKSLAKLKTRHRAPLGAFAGEAGMIYFLTHCGVLWRRPELLAEAEKLAGSLSERIPDDSRFDLVSGSAGLIAVLLGLQEHRPSQKTLALAQQCGNHLLEHAQRMPEGTGWITFANASAPLAGFSHGAAGIAWALIKLASATGEHRFREVAVEALQYERSLFSVQHRNWPDLRKARREDQAVPYPIAWCHGAPGIGLSRALILDHYQDEEIHGEITAAAQTTLTRNLGINDSLCHGNLGNCEALLHGAKFVQDSALADRIRAVPFRILAGIRQRGWKCGVPMEVETPGLMVGVAGIGYGLLRLADPLHVPAVVALSPPVKAGA